MPQKKAPQPLAGFGRSFARHRAAPRHGGEGEVPLKGCTYPRSPTPAHAADMIRPPATSPLPPNPAMPDFWSQSLIPTLRQAPGDAEVPSHQLMLRAGMVRKLGSGSYTYLPLGLRSLSKVAAIIREEMRAAGAAEIFMPTLQPIELWQKTGRDQSYGENLFQLDDRHGRHYALGRPTKKSSPTSSARASAPTKTSPKPSTRSRPSSATSSARASACCVPASS